MKLLLFIIPFFFIGCQTQDSSIDVNQFNSSDSTKIINSILDSMKVELNNQWFMTEIERHVTCTIPPFYSPSISIDINQNESVLLNYEHLNPKSISDSIVKFYSTNIIKNDLSSNAPLYIRVSKLELKERIQSIEDEITRLKESDNYSLDILEFRIGELAEWKNKFNIFKTLNTNFLIEPDNRSGIMLDYPKDCKINEQILDTILIGFYKVRELDAQHYFKESYAKLFWKATNQSDTLAMDKIEAIKMLHPIAIIDYPKCKIKSILPPPLN